MLRYGASFASYEGDDWDGDDGGIDRRKPHTPRPVVSARTKPCLSQSKMLTRSMETTTTIA
jgi:hypothetical protein